MTHIKRCQSKNKLIFPFFMSCSISFFPILPSFPSHTSVHSQSQHSPLHKAGVTGCNFSCSLSRNVGKRKPFQVAGEMLQGQSQAELAMVSKIPAIVAKSGTEFCFEQSLQAQTSCKTSCRKGVLHAATYLQLVSQTPL